MHTSASNVTHSYHPGKKHPNNLVYPKKRRIFASLNSKKVDSLAQLVEHNTFNVGVLGSNPKRITKRKAKRRQQKDKSYKINILWDFFYCLLTTLTATKRSLTDKK